MKVKINDISNHSNGSVTVSFEVIVIILFAISIIADEVFPSFVQNTGASLGRLLLPVMAFLLVTNLKNIRPAPGLRGFVAWFAVCSLSALIVYLSGDYSYSLANSFIIPYASSIMVYQFVYQFIKTTQDFHRILYSFLFSIVLALIYMFMTGELVYYEDRLRGAISNANGFGRLVGLATVVALFASIRGKKWAIFSALFLFIILLRTGSRGALIATLSAMLYLLFMDKNLISKRLFSIIIFVLLLGVGWYLFLQESATLEQRYRNIILYEDGLDTAHRTDIFIAAFHLIAEHPIWGVGLDQASSILYKYYGEYLPPVIYFMMKNGQLDTHNTYLFILAETGIIGFVPFAWALWQIGRFNYLSQQRKELYSNLCIGIFAFFLLNGIVGTLIVQKLWWLGLGLSVSGSSLENIDRE